jgi:hypothetical protein
MKKAASLTLGVVLVAGPAFGALGDIVGSFPAPGDYPAALAVAGNYTSFLFVYCHSAPYSIYRIGGISGSIYSSYASPQGSYTRGLTFSYGGGGGLPSGNYLWMGNYSTDNIYRCNYDNGSVYASIPANHDMYGGIAVSATGDGGYAPTYMLSDETSPSKMFRQHLTTGSVYSSWSVSANVFDLAWDWRSQLIWTGQNGNYVYGWTTAGSLVASFAIPNRSPLGFAYTSNYLWVACTVGSPSHYIYRIHCPQTNISVTPASVGKVKNLFR